MSSKRMTANPIKAPRYRPGKAVAEEQTSSEEEDSDQEEAADDAPPKKPTKSTSAPPKAITAAGIRSDLSKVDLNERRRLGAAKETQRLKEEEELRKKEEEGFVTEEEEESGDESDSGSGEGGSGSEEQSSEEEAPRRMIRPTFIKKINRGSGATKNAVADSKTEEELAGEEERRRKAAADDIVEEQIRKDLAAKEAGKKNWDDDEDDADEVDDTDDIDPEAEYAAWKLRELKRIKREREAIEEREKEREEVERRKALTEEERRREDEEYIAKQKEEKESKGKAGYLQKYYHKGAFFQDDAKAAGLDKRDIMGSRFVDEVDREVLPQALQMRDMTKVGKKGATKYKDLRSEDTGRWGDYGGQRGLRRDGDGMKDERFMSDRERERVSASGANNVPVGERRGNDSQGPDGSRIFDDYRPGQGQSSRSRSRSPYQDNRRKRGTSRETDRSNGDKRRRVDSR